MILLIAWLIQAITILIIVDVIISWVPSISQQNPAVVIIRDLAKAILAPFRKVIPPIRAGNANVDITPIIAIISLRVIGNILIKLLQI